MYIMHHTRPRQATSNSDRAMLSIIQTLVADSSHRLAVNSISSNTTATNALDSGNRYFSSVVESTEACVSDTGEPDLVTDCLFLVRTICQILAKANDSRKSTSHALLS